MIDAALAYAKLHWRVFPVWGITDGKCDCGGLPKCKPGKHPIHFCVPRGLTNAQNIPQVIEAWWKKFPNANIGLVTGRVNNLFVLDVDIKNDGDEHLKEFEKEHGAVIPDDYTGRVITGSGGYHYYYRYPKNIDCNNRTGIIPGIDIRADGGYVIAPPSKHISGGKYEWEI
jgi:putative DNA primase/helicase